MNGERNARSSVPAVWRLLGDVEALGVRETDALTRRDFEELDEIQTRKAMLLSALSRAWERAGAPVRNCTELRARIEALVANAHRNRAQAARFVEEIASQAVEAGSTSRLLREIRRTYTGNDGPAGRLLESR